MTGRPAAPCGHHAEAGGRVRPQRSARACRPGAPQKRPARAAAAAGIAALILAMAGCGGSGSSGPPSEKDIGDVGLAQEQIPQACLNPAGADDTQLSASVDTLIRVYESSDPDAEFEFVPGAPKQTMRRLMTSARDALRACAQAGRSAAASDLASRIESQLDK